MENVVEVAEYLVVHTEHIVDTDQEHNTEIYADDKADAQEQCSSDQTNSNNLQHYDCCDGNSVTQHLHGYRTCHLFLVHNDHNGHHVHLENQIQKKDRWNQQTDTDYFDEKNWTNTEAQKPEPDLTFDQRCLTLELR